MLVHSFLHSLKRDSTYICTYRSCWGTRQRQAKAWETSPVPEPANAVELVTSIEVLAAFCASVIQRALSVFTRINLTTALKVGAVTIPLCREAQRC